jgi:hypothetical protein
MNTATLPILLPLGSKVVTHVGHQDQVVCIVVGYEPDDEGRVQYVVRTATGTERVRGAASCLLDRLKVE